LQFEYEKSGFKWDEHRQQQVLGSFYWTNWMTQLLGGVLAKYYGTKLIFGLANIIPILLCAITPISCYINYQIAIVLRAISGFFAGLAWPGYT
jgi:MFS transporter, ACS family, solute carrier family 17 (sodium-dependent inorganic phosphate cotransporter), member 5